MNFYEIAKLRQSCRKYNPEREVEEEKLQAILETARLSPSACNCQPYHITVCRGEVAKEVGKATVGMGINRFTADVPVMLVISEKEYNKTAALGAILKHNDYRSLDIGILSAFITLEAEAQGLGSCIIGWFDTEKIKEVCHLEKKPRLIVALGYAAEGDLLREKKRKSLEDLVTYL